MASVHLSRERYTWKVGSTRTPRLSYDEILEKKAPDGTGTNELLTGTPTVVEVTTTDLTIDNKAVSTTSLDIRNETIITGRALTFRVSGHLVANAPYTIKITVSTDATPAQTFVKELIIDVEA